MSDSASTEFSVEIAIEGIIMLLYERDEAGRIVACVAGVVRNVPDHVFSVTGRKFNLDGSTTDFTFDPTRPQLLFEAQGTTQTGISFAGGEIDRAGGGGDPQSFSWVLDFEGPELYDREIGVDPRKFLSTFRINQGELHTQTVSENYLLARREDSLDAPLTFIGKVATRVGVRLNLDQAGGVARLSNGADELVVNHGERLLAEVKLICPTENLRAFGQRAAHGNNYYKAVGHKLEWGEKKLFSSTEFKIEEDEPVPPISPEASCLVGGASRSNPTG